MNEYYFNGTNIKFRFTILDSTGLIPQTGKATGASVTAYDSAKAADAIASTTITEVGNGVYEANILYSEINIGAGFGLWTFALSHTNTDLVFEPPAIQVLINVEIGTVTGTPTTTVATFTGLLDLTTDHYKESLIRVLTGNNAGEVKDITASTNNGGNVQLTFHAMSAALVSSDKVMIINI